MILPTAQHMKGLVNNKLKRHVAGSSCDPMWQYPSICLCLTQSAAHFLGVVLTMHLPHEIM